MAGCVRREDVGPLGEVLPSRMTRKKLFTAAVAIVAFLGVFFLYAHFRQAHVGASDWYGYYAEAMMFKSGRLHLDTRLDPSKFPAVAPLGFHVVEGRVVPQYPPGYPLLLALASFAGLEFYVTPLFGALTAMLMFLLLRDFAGRFWAWVFTSLWVFSPVVVSSSTYVMSDIVAAFFILFSLFLARKSMFLSSGLVLGFALLVRPSNILFGILLIPMLVKKKGWLQFSGGFGFPALSYAVYNLYQYGAPWKTGYPTTGVDLTSSVFFHHFVYYLKEIWIQFTPLLILLALFALFRLGRRGVFFAAWFGLFLVFYSFWRPGADVWWYIRFLLPGIPALVILAGHGAAELEILLKSKKLRLFRFIRHILTGAAVAVLAYFFYFSSDKIIYKTGKGKVFRDVSMAVAAAVPPDSLVGSLGFSGPLRLYGDLESFCLYHANSRHLVNHMIEDGVPVYIIVQPFGWDHNRVKRILRQFDSERVLTFFNREDFCLLRLKQTGR